MTVYVDTYTLQLYIIDLTQRRLNTLKKHNFTKQARVAKGKKIASLLRYEAKL